MVVTVVLMQIGILSFLLLWRMMKSVSTNQEKKELSWACSEEGRKRRMIFSGGMKRAKGEPEENGVISIDKRNKLEQMIRKTTCISGRRVPVPYIIPAHVTLLTWMETDPDSGGGL